MGTKSIATLTFYDNVAATVQSFANALSGTFQLSYGGEETAVMQASVTAAGMQEALAGVSTIGVAPTVTKSTVGVGSPSVTWTISFDSKDGDAKKQTFKYTDAINSERKTSAVLGSTGVALSNTISAAAGAGVWAAGAKNSIVMQYTQEGSTFYDALSTTAATVHDELAADTTVGTTLDVQAAEDIYWYLYQESGAAITDVDAGVCAGWVVSTGNTLSKAPSLIFEFNGEFTAPVPMCSSNAFFSVLGAFETEIQKLTGLKTASVFIGGLGAVVVNANSDALFQKHFPWSATHFGTAVAHMAISLPIGVDGSSFRVHAQIDSVIGWRLMATGEGTAYTYRARNNNGRQFTATQAYENKIAGGVHFSRGAAATLAAAHLGTASGVVASAVGTWNPGTYYNVRLYPAAGAGVAHAAVTIKASGIAKVEITAGGLLAEADGGGTKGVFHIKCDTRLASGLTDTSANNAACATPGVNNIIVVTLGNSATAATTNILQASLVVGSVPSAIADAQDDCATSQAVASQGSSFLLAGNAAGGGTPTTHLIT